MNNKGIEVGVNLIVVLILSIVVLGFGIKLVWDMYKGAGELTSRLEPSVDQKLGELLITENAPVVSYPQSKTVNVGGSYVFGLAVRNMGDNKHFYVDAVKGVAVKQDGKAPVGENKVEFLVAPKKFSMGRDEAKKLGIAVSVPYGAASGTYVLNVYVCNSNVDLDACPANSDKQYDNVQKLRVIVP